MQKRNYYRWTTQRTTAFTIIQGHKMAARTGKVTGLTFSKSQVNKSSHSCRTLTHQTQFYRELQATLEGPPLQSTPAGLAMRMSTFGTGSGSGTLNQKIAGLTTTRHQSSKSNFLGPGFKPKPEAQTKHLTHSSSISMTLSSGLGPAGTSSGPPT